MRGVSREYMTPLHPQPDVLYKSGSQCFINGLGPHLNSGEKEMLPKPFLIEDSPPDGF